MWLPLTRPLLGTWPATRAHALTGNQTRDPLIHGPVLNPLSHTSQDSNIFTFKLKLMLSFDFDSFKCKKKKKERKVMIAWTHEVSVEMKKRGQKEMLWR